MAEAQIISFSKEYADYLRDESRSTGQADSISFPATESAVVEILTQVRLAGGTITLQGARTGIAAGAVPGGGHIMNLSRLNLVTGLRGDATGFFLTVQPGVILSELREALEQKKFTTAGWTAESLVALNKLQESGHWFFPPDPTETSASIGGMAACNASGARSFHYGPTRQYIEALRVVIPNGTVLSLRRGREKAQGRSFRLEQDGIVVAAGTLPGYRMLAVKNASGYFAAADMDLLDLFIGSEGTLGIITEVELRLLPTPDCSWGMTAFFRSEAEAVEFVRKVRGEGGGGVEVKPVAIEYFNSHSLDLLREQKKANPAFATIPDLPPEYHTAIYVEYQGESEEAVTEAVMTACEILVACGGDDEATWIATNEREMERLHYFRHAVPEAVNLLIDQRRQGDPRLTKLGTDMAVPDGELVNILELYNRDLAGSGLESVMFGHVGDNHIHVNILPRNMEDYQRGRQLYRSWSREVIRMSGTVSAEHGVGKLKVTMLEEMYGVAGMAEMRAVKESFDPGNILGRGNLFAAD